MRAANGASPLKFNVALALTLAFFANILWHSVAGTLVVQKQAVQVVSAPGFRELLHRARGFGFSHRHLEVYFNFACSFEGKLGHPAPHKERRLGRALTRGSSWLEDRLGLGASQFGLPVSATEQRAPGSVLCGLV